MLPRPWRRAANGQTKAKEQPEAWSKQASIYFRLLLTPDYAVWDLVLLAGGIVFSIAAGIPFPLLGILFGQLINDVNSSDCAESTGADTASLERSVAQKALYVLYVTIANFAFIWISTTCWSMFGERLVRRLRGRYLRSLLRQELAFFDNLPAGDVSARLSNDLENIQTGTSEKVGIVIQTVSYFAASYVVAFIKDAKLAGILVSLVPAYFLMAFIGSHFIKRYAGRLSDSIALSTSIASESLNKLAVVHAFGANARLEAKFAEHTSTARCAGTTKAFVAAVQLALLYFIAYSTNALAYWQGSISVAQSVEQGEGASRIGAVYTVIFLLIDASFILSQVAPFMQIFGTAAGASEKLNNAIARKSKIDGTDEVTGRRFDRVDGCIEFDNVSFCYPSRPDTVVIKDLSITIPAWKHTAIVGQSGSGKSTVAALMARLYDPAKGVIRLDGADIRDLNVRHLRGCIGAVQQDPALLDRSILENIAHGLINSDAPHDEICAVLDGEVSDFVEQVCSKGDSFDTALATQSRSLRRVVDRVVKAAAVADATGFIQDLEHGFATSVGSAGHQFSGGQKQRIALARAMMRNPRILLLDEATSALDSRSERSIQGALQEASKGRTTISIVHRLSTVKTVDNIIVMRNGMVVEQGSHPQLMAANGTYASMVRLQSVSARGGTEVLGYLPTKKTSDEISSSGDWKSDENVDKEKSQITKTAPMAKTDKKEDKPGPSRSNHEKNSKEGLARGVLSTIAGICSLTRAQALSLLVAFTAAAIVGGSYSGEAVIFGHTISSFSGCNTPAAIRNAGHFWGLLFFILAIIEFFANLTMGSLFGRISENLLYKIRVLCFRTLIGQDMDWHESDGRDPASLLALLTTDSNALAGLTGTVLGTLFSIIINSIAGIALSLAIAWRIAIVLLACVPVLLGAGIMRLRCFKKFHEKHAKAFSGATGYAVEAVNSIRVISIFSLEEEAVNVYHRALRAPYRETLKMLLWSNAWLASAYSVGNLVYALAYWWGTQNIIDGWYSQTQFFIVLPALLFSAQTCGQLFALAPDFSKSRLSAAKILDLLDTGKKAMTVSPQALRAGPHVDSNSDLGGGKDVEAGPNLSEKSLRDPSGTAVSFSSVEFSYPARPNIPVLRGLDIDVQPGQFCALVGPSGAGKSTIISLIERFYQPSAGKVTLDSRNIAELVGSSFRNDIALVPQDSVMFEGTLQFNLSLGARPNEDVSQDAVETACKLAHIHDTILSLPDKYATRCGPNGNQFSGGQRQRISIARALLRKPRLLLLDESTSALDSESEKMVQDALENLRRDGGLTVVAIAHRLHTIEKADCIFVIEEGKCTAKGTHKELLRDSETYRTNALHQVLRD